MANDGFYRTALIGGDPAAVDGIDGDDVVDKDLILAMVSNILYIYEVDADSAAAESSPDVIAFDANGGDKRAVLKAALAGTGASRFPGEIALIGGQIAFPATAVPSADANTLDDYEEGTWTPAITFGGAAVDVTYGGSRAGSYTKIGNVVHFRGYLQLANKGSSNGVVLMTGMPFTASNVAGHQAAVTIGHVTAISFANQLFVDVAANTTTARFLEATEAGANTAITDAEFANTSAMVFSGSYVI